MHPTNDPHPHRASERGNAGFSGPADDQFITIPHRDGERRVQVSIETINKFGGSWSLESAIWH